MRKIINVFKSLLGGIIMLISFLFLIIEGRLLCSGDWITYEFMYIGCLQYCFRFILAIFSFVIGLLPLICLRKKNKTIIQLTFYGSISLCIVSLILMIYAVNYMGEVFAAISCMYLILNITTMNE